MQSGPSVSQRAVSSPPTKCSGGRDNVSPPRVVFLTPPLCSSEAESEKGFQKLSRLVSGRKKEKKKSQRVLFYFLHSTPPHRIHADNLPLRYNSNPTQSLIRRERALRNV